MNGRQVFPKPQIFSITVTRSTFAMYLTRAARNRGTVLDKVRRPSDLIGMKFALAREDEKMAQHLNCQDVNGQERC